MNTIRTLLVAACAAIIAALAPATTHAAVTPGARYDEASTKPGLRQFVAVSKDAAKLSDYRLSARGRCSDGSAFNDAVPFNSESGLGEPPTIRVDATGAFTATQVERSAALDRGKKSYTGSLRSTITGQSSPDGTVVTVTQASTFAAKGLRCTTSGSVSLYREGTPQAPLSNASMTTGTYPGISGKGITIRPFKAIAPAAELRNFVIRGTARCPGGRRVRTVTSVPTAALSPRYTFAQATGESATSDPGFETETVERLTLRLFKRAATYGYRGTYTARVTFTRKGRRGKPCRVPLTRFQAGIPAKG